VRPLLADAAGQQRGSETTRRTAPLKNDPNFANNSPSRGRSSFQSVGRRPIVTPCSRGSATLAAPERSRGSVTQSRLSHVVSATSHWCYTEVEKTCARKT